MASGGKITHFIWTDIPAEDETAFNAWYNEEHMPDRVVRIPGFLRGRRFSALSGGPRYLAYYEMANRDVFWSEDYVRMRSEPDPRSRYFVAKFRNALRSTSTIDSEIDTGEGRFLGIAGLTRPEDEAEAPAPFSAAAVAPIAAAGGLSRIRLSRTDPELVQGNFKRMAAHTRGSLRPPDRVPAWVLTVEGETAAAVAGGLDVLQNRFGPQAKVEARAVMELVKAVSPSR